MARHYRDPVDAVRERIGEVREEVRAIEVELGSVLPQALGWERIEAIRRLKFEVDEVEAGARGDDAAVLSALEGYHGALEALRSALPSIEHEWTALPDEVGLLPWPRVDERASTKGCVGDEVKTWVARCSRRVELWVRSVDASGVMQNVNGAAGWRATLTAARAPLVFDGWVERARGMLYGGCLEPKMVMATSVRRCVPRLRLRPEGVFETATRRYRRAALWAELDAYFVLEGSAAASEIFGERALREALVQIARDDIPTLEVDAGLAVLTWRFEPREATMKAAVEVLSAMRRVRSVGLREG